MANNRRKQPSWADGTEEIIDDVVKAFADDIEFIIDAFMPDGRRFREELLSEEEQLQMYLSEGLHDNADAAKNWIRSRVVQLTQEIQRYGVPPEMAIRAHPYDIVETAAFKFSARMEKLLKEREGGTGAVGTPPVPMNPDGDGNWLIQMAGENPTLEP